MSQTSEPAPIDQLVAEVLDHIKRSPYARGVSVDPGHARSVIQRHYFDVKPWPFGAIT